MQNLKIFDKEETKSVLSSLDSFLGFYLALAVCLVSHIA